MGRFAPVCRRCWAIAAAVIVAGAGTSLPPQAKAAVAGGGDPRRAPAGDFVTASADAEPGEEGGSEGSGRLWIFPEWFLSRDPSPELQPLPSEWEIFPRYSLFRAPFADVREPRSELALLVMDLPDESRTDGFAFIGDTIGFIGYNWRRRGPGDVDGVQLGGQAFTNPQVGVAGELNGKLVNVDFILGPALAVRQGPFSARMRYYHQSSHLGDEFIQSRPGVDRINLSFEALETMVSYHAGFWRFYGGGAVKTRIDPPSVKRGELHFGVEYRTGWRFLTIGRLALGYDVHLFEQHDWVPDHSAQFGIEFGKDDPTRRHFSVLFQYYNGRNPFGQFFLDSRRISFAGLGLRFSH